MNLLVWIFWACVYLFLFCKFVCFCFCFWLNLWLYFVATTKSLVGKLTTRFLAFHLMDAIRICYPQYWLKIDAKKNFNYHLMLIKSHLELVKSLEENTPIEVVRICPSILSVSALDLRSSAFKMIMKSNVVIAMEVPFHVNP